MKKVNFAQISFQMDKNNTFLRKKELLLISFLFLFLTTLFSQIPHKSIDYENSWVDSVYNSLSIKQKIGQMIFVRANYPNEPYLIVIDTLIKNYNIGGVVFFKGNPVSQANKTNHWNSLAQTPLFVSIDAEWGLGMRLKNTIKYPLQMALGAIQDDNLIYAMGKQIGTQCRRLGIHINFAPVVDVNSNPKNPVIGMRSFGQNPELVAKKGSMYMKGMQASGVIACAKHFPGHGNTFVDSHHDLPVVNSNLQTLKKNDLYPFQYLIDEGVNSVMIAHLSVPELDNTKNLPSTLSHKIVTDYLIDTMGFSGLIITDGLDMKGVTKNYKEGVVALKALEAGNDILLIPDNIPLSIQNIANAVNNGVILESRIEHSCKKILRYKYRSGLWDCKSIETSNLISDLNNRLYKSTSELLTESSITLVKNENDILPVNDKFLSKRALLVVGTQDNLEIENAISMYGSFDIFHIEHNAKKRERKKLLSKLRDYELVIAAVLNTNILASRRFGITQTDVDMIESIAMETKVVLDVFASPYSLDFFDLNSIEAVIVSYQEKQSAQNASAKMIMVGSEIFCTLPVDAGKYKAGWGLEMGSSKLRFINPDVLGIDTDILQKIDSTVASCIEIEAFPGCQIIAAKNGAIFYNKSFGYHTYDGENKVELDDIYDLASLTKILATTPALMKMSEDSSIDLNDKISDYLLMLEGTDKEDLGFFEVLSHQSGLQNWIPFYQSTIDDKGWDISIYQPIITEEFPTRVAENMYVHKGYNHILIDSIIDSPFQDKTYHYSGLGFYLLKVMIENINNTSLDNYVYDNFYDTLNLKSLIFNPRNNYDLDMIIPTENDTFFRMQLVHGDVHDQGAALLGGVSGNAGLFGNTYDVAVMMQMFLNGGTYGKTKLFEKETIDFFNKYHFAADSNRRGLGFDKPLHKYEEHRTNCKDVSPLSFGHSGFTGTYAWADPDNGLVYVFLSNRVHPSMGNSKLMDLDVRTNIHQLFYDALKPRN